MNSRDSIVEIHAHLEKYWPSQGDWGDGVALFTGGWGGDGS